MRAPEASSRGVACHLALAALLGSGLLGCRASGDFRLQLVFPDESSREITRDVSIWALGARGASCEELVAGRTEPEEMVVLAFQRWTWPLAADLPPVLAGVPTGDLHFFAEARGERDNAILRGCSRVRVESGLDLRVRIGLQWICPWNPAGEIQNNGLDDDCDGLTDDCAASAECDDQNGCSSDQCFQGECRHFPHPDGLECDDGAGCTVGDSCQAGSCAGLARDCASLDALCLVGACQEESGECVQVAAPAGEACEDGSACTAGDTCREGVCAGETLDCEDGDPCTEDRCLEEIQACAHLRSPRPGLEGAGVAGSCANAVDDDCDGWTDEDDANCLACLDEADCDDQDPCTTDRCEQACLNEPVADGAPCDDGSFCTDPDACLAGRCAGEARACPGDGSCQRGLCREDPPGCDLQPLADGTPCADGLLCTVADSCAGGTCQGAGRACDDGDRCTQDGCDEAAGGCSHVPQLFPGAEGPAQDPTCGNGVDDDCDGRLDAQDPDCADCNGGQGCDDGDVCTLDSCTVSGCEHTPAPDGTGCQDGSFCTEPDACLSGACVGGAARSCDDGNPCSVDACDEGADTCTHGGDLVFAPSDFEGDTLSPWMFHTDTEGRCFVGPPGFEGEHSAVVEIVAPAENIQLFQGGISLAPATGYRLCFAARSSLGHDLQVLVFQHVEPWTPLGLDALLTLTADFQRYSLDFTTPDGPGTHENSRVTFWPRQEEAGETYQLDSIWLVRRP